MNYYYTCERCAKSSGHRNVQSTDDKAALDVRSLDLLPIESILFINGNLLCQGCGNILHTET